MNYWRMYFRIGNQGPEMWPECFAHYKKKDFRWVIIDCYCDDFVFCDEYQYINVNVIFDDEYEVKVSEIPSYVGIPEKPPKNWSLSEIVIYANPDNWLELSKIDG